MTDSKQAESGIQRWLRTATILLTILSPVINNVAARLADRLEQGGRRAKDVKADIPDTALEKVGTTRQSLSDALLELKDHPYSQELLKRGENLVEELQDLVDRGSKLSQSLLVHSSEVTDELAERASKASQELAKRSEETRKELRKRGKKLNKELSRRSERVAKELRKRSDKLTKELRLRSRRAARRTSGQSGLFWIISGFSVGLTIAGVAAYVLIRQRIKQQLEEEQSFQLPRNDYLNIASTATISDQGPTRAATQPEAVIQKGPEQAEEGVPAIAVQESSVPADAAFVGVVSTRRYYPASTPLDQLSENGKIDVVYFSTEEEAKVQGYTSSV